MNEIRTTSERRPPEACALARATLDVARPGEGDLSQVEAARQHLDECPACRAAVRRNQRFDSQLGPLFRDVPVPGDLKQRLLASLGAVDSGAADSALPAAAPETPAVEVPPVLTSPRNPVNKVSRRRWLRFTTVAAAVLVAAGVWLALYPWSRPVDLDVLVGQTLQEGFGPELLPEGARFASGAEAVLPRSMNTRYITAPARKLEEQDAAVFFFRLPAVRRGRSAVEGHLVIVPMSRLLAVPAATAFGNDPPVYRTGGYCTMSWVEGEFAYVCCVKGGENDLKRLSPPRPVAI